MLLLIFWAEHKYCLTHFKACNLIMCFLMLPPCEFDWTM